MKRRRKRLFQMRVLVVLGAALCLLALAGPAAADDSIPPIPPQYYGSVQTTDGQPVEEGIVRAYIDGEERSPKPPTYLPFTFTGGFYGDPEHEKLAVTGSNEDTGKQVTFKVEVKGYLYPAQTYVNGSLATVYWASGDTKQVDLKIPPVIIIKGQVCLEKVQPSDPEPNHQGTLVKATQGGNIFGPVESDSSGAYEITGLAPSTAYQVEFTHPGASWKKEVRPITTPAAGGTLELPKVTLYLGDMNSDGAINILDLLWMASVMGPVTPEAQKADVNKDGQVNILDLLRVAQNMGL